MRVFALVWHSSFFFSSRRRHTRWTGDWSSDVCSSDLGFVSAPSSGVWNPNGQWEVENHGIAPDIEAELDPELTLKGRDPQLEKAVQVVMEELKQNPLPHPHRPAYPNYHSKEADPR